MLGVSSAMFPAAVLASRAMPELICQVESLGSLIGEGDFRRNRRPRRVCASGRVAKPKPYKGSKAAKRASRPKRQLTRRQRWGA